jgi:hypothetical protein
MSHTTAATILNSLFEIFDPAKPEYAGVREHFSSGELAEIDRIRALPLTHSFSFAEKTFCSYVVSKAIYTGS